MAPMPLTGTIGTSSSLKSGGEAVPHRRTLPEPVVTFHLPTTRRVVAVEKPSKRAKQIVRDTQTPNNDPPAEPELSLEASSILLQSLRQSRLIHLTAMLPYLSNRHRTSTKYHPSPPDHPFPGGLEPTTTPHSLIHLGRADVRIGPLIFPKTRFGEVRVERINTGESLVAAAPKAEPPALDSTEGISATSASTSAAKNTPAPPKPKATPATGGTIQTPPPIDDAVVQAVSKAAQKDPKLQALLHTAANGKATPEELRELARFISHVSESLDRDKKKDTPREGVATSEATAPTRPSVSTAPPASTPSANPTQSSSRPVPPPLQINQPSHAPIITVEFRENPSARFILPLWRGAAVERISTGNERRIKVTALLPAIGSTAASRAAPTEGKVSKKKETPREGGKESTSKNHSTSLISPTEEQLTAPAPKGAETHSVTWILSGSLDTPLTDSIWQCFGRVKGARTMVDGRQVDDLPSSGDVEKYLADFVAKLRSSRSETSFIPQMHLSRASVIKELSEHLTDKFAPRMQSLVTKPIAKLKRGGEADDDDVEVIRETNKRSANGRILGEERKNKKANLAGGLDGHTLPRSKSFDDDGSSPHKDLQQQHQNQVQPIKRKRHVAKYNSDGTLKLCQACGTNTTPMWRRGPAGKSTLCNACGAKWKVGRLVVPNEAAVDASFNTTVEEATAAEEAAAEQPQAEQPVTTPPTHSTPPPSAREEQTATASVEVTTAIDP